jgi:uncharacterized protein YutE (UPF0331/DUF86 family)
VSLLLLLSTPYHEDLLLQAERLVQVGHLEAAVVLSQMAAEIRTEQAFLALATQRGIPELADLFAALLPSFNLGNERVRSVFETLSKNRFSQQPIWTPFKEHVSRRNAVVHKGLRVSVDQARESIAAVTDLIRHLDSM